MLDGIRASIHDDTKVSTHICSRIGDHILVDVLLVASATLFGPLDSGKLLSKVSIFKSTTNGHDPIM